MKTKHCFGHYKMKSVILTSYIMKIVVSNIDYFSNYIWIAFRLLFCFSLPPNFEEMVVDAF